MIVLEIIDAVYACNPDMATFSSCENDIVFCQGICFYAINKKRRISTRC